MVHIGGRNRGPSLMLWNGTAIWLTFTSLIGGPTLTRVASCVFLFGACGWQIFLGRNGPDFCTKADARACGASGGGLLS